MIGTCIMKELSILFEFDDPDDQILTLKKFLTNFIDEHAARGRVNLTHPIAPWMKDRGISKRIGTISHKSLRPQQR